MLQGDIRDPAVRARRARRPRVRRGRRLRRLHARARRRPTSTSSPGRTGQYVFISSASAYQTPPARAADRRVDAAAQPVSGSTRATRSPARSCSCAPTARTASRRPSCAPRTPTTARTLPVRGRLDRRRAHAPRARRSSCTATAPRCGRSPTTSTSPRASSALLGHPQAIGDSFHITSDEVLTWNQIHELVAAAAGAEPRIVHVPSDAIAAADAEWGARRCWATRRTR